MAEDHKVVLHEEEIGRALTRIAHEILERNSGDGVPAVVGIHSRGAFLANRLHGQLQELIGAEVPLGDLDIGFYRDDLGTRPDAPVLHASHIDFDLTSMTVVIVDDVLYTGRTVRAAIEALFAYGRPRRVQLAVLVDRGHRELPIRPDYVGKNLPTSRAEHVHVRLRERDGVDEVSISLETHGGAGSASSFARVQSTPRSLRPGPACPASPGELPAVEAT
ncbi:MAG TPA: bifunctional pyr operon transcriptional regulator/uracil phosphoribosyltransferase PyrR [Solirubrobacteraceae bacterium]|jgi:pyrimidine operon attenuation protein/uracil phosphoribosyltransferase|nr:bifunctional pyr operon transcriptional regulator/uracil phosphoribosyltransferase PyrR [Solirubrobacteraceae bacterium]